MSNHVSHADSPALAAVISHPLHWVFKKELSRIPVFGWVLLACGQIMVDRTDPERSKVSLREALTGLSGNNSVMIYPEGTRSRDGNLQPLKKGGFWMALQAGLPIVPVRVSGTREIVAADSLRIRPGNVLVELFPPIPTAGMGMADLPALMRQVREAMLSGRRDPA
jgi:1-acyl-sn-glycerol-3-phosphate acyltransferase